MFRRNNRYSHDAEFTSKGYLGLFWRQLRKNRRAMIALVVLGILYLMMFFSPLIVNQIGYDPHKTYVGERNEHPNAEHWFGTDHLGRDLFSRVVMGSRISLTIGLVAAAISVTIGTTVGAISGYYGGTVDNLLMRLVDVIRCFPFLFLAITVVTILSPNFFNIVVVIAILAWTGLARLVRANVLSLKERDFFCAARAVGAGTGRLVFRHLVPNTMAPVIVSATLQVAGAILAESALSYLGLGVQPPTPSWGNILMGGKPYLTSNFWYTFWPGLMIFVTVMCINFLGDGLRDALDPKIAKARG
jgi:peptide/nickel transport system permease protein